MGKNHKFRRGDVIVKNDKVHKGATSYYVSSYDNPWETRYTIEYINKSNYDTFILYSYKLKEANYMFVYDTKLVDEEFDLDIIETRKNKIKNIQSRINI